MGTHAHTQTGELHPAGDGTDANNISPSEQTKQNKTKKPTKRMNANQKKQVRQLFCRSTHVSQKYYV